MKFVHPDQAAVRPVSHDPAILKRVVIEAGEVPPLTGLAQVRLVPGQRTTPHAHADMVEVFLVLEGCGTFVVNDLSVSAPSGSCVVVEPGDVHEIVNSAAEDLVLSYFGIQM